MQDGLVLSTNDVLGQIYPFLQKNCLNGLTLTAVQSLKISQHMLITVCINCRIQFNEWVANENLVPGGFNVPVITYIKQIMDNHT